METVKAFRIIEWRQRYEVTSHGKEADADTPVEALRKNPLKYIRSKVQAHKHGNGWRQLLKLAWRPDQLNELATFGLFQKLTELAGEQTAELRGWILDSKGRPIGAAGIAAALGLDQSSQVKLIQDNLDILCSEAIGWVEFVSFSPAGPQPPLTPPTFPGKEGRDGEPYIIKSKGNTIEIERQSEQGPTSSRSSSEEEKPQPDRLMTTLVKGHANKVKMTLTTVMGIKPDQEGDMTAMGDIVDRIAQRVTAGADTVEVFGQLVKAGRQAAGANKPIAAFISAAKKPPFNCI